MDHRALIGKPIRDTDWTCTKYFIPKRIRTDSQGRGLYYVGTSYKFDGRIVEHEEWNLRAWVWVLAYDILASIEVDRLLED
jgi:hypothetical protein